MPDIRGEIAAKLNPKAVRVSPFFTAMLALLLDEEWTNPPMRTAGITSDGYVIGRTEDGIATGPLACIEDVESNIRGVSVAAGLTPDQTAWLIARTQTAFGPDWRRAARSN